jgi:radical SAM protein with 4Fe4S-binding SPASM domain
MHTIDTIQILQSTIGNPFSRRILSGLGYCSDCGKNRIEVALELYVGARHQACIKCRIAEITITGLLRSGGSIFGINPSDLKNHFSHSSWRKGLANVLNGIAQFGIKQPFVSGAPFLVVWDVTYRCNLKCKHCYSNAGQTFNHELTTEQAKHVIDKLDHASIPIIAFSGGEPLVRNDIFKLIRYATDKGLYVALATNATLISKVKAQQIKEAGVKFTQISLDGATAKTHDKFRGINGVYNKTLQGIKNCVDNNLFVNIATTATNYNYQEIPRIIDLCEKLQVNWFMLYNFIPTGRGEFIQQNDLTPIEREKLLHFLWDRLKNGHKVNVLSTAPQFARVALESEFNKEKKIIPTHFINPEFSGKLLNLSKFIGGCGCGRFYCAIRANGDIEPCVFFPLKIGNILSDNFENIWRNNQVLHQLRDKDQLHGNCGTCKHRYICGGCRARAYGYTGEYLASDPGCIRNS